MAIVGAGPAGFFVAEHLLKRDGVVVRVDMFERLPAPFGLVRFGVAPDHPRIKQATRTFEKVASDSRFRYFGNVEVGVHVTWADLCERYHQVCAATGAQADRRLNIPGEDLEGSHSATDFVAWYNGHPDFAQLRFDLSAESVVIVGVGNVALDVARILCRPVSELATTDIADHALDSLRSSRVREVTVLGRRGPAQAAFSASEIKEIGRLADVDVLAPHGEIALDPLSQSWVTESGDRALQRKLDVLAEFAERRPAGYPRRLNFRFLVSPVELVSNGGRVSALRLVRNELYAAEDGSLRPKATKQCEQLPADLVFRSAGYRGVPMPGLPFDDTRCMIPNDRGRVVDPMTGTRIKGCYVSGWIKRQPVGVIGTNKPDAAETVASMLEDVAAGVVLRRGHCEEAGVEQLVADRCPGYLSFEDWKRIDDIEVRAGKAQGRPRVKITSASEMLALLGRGES